MIFQILLWKLIYFHIWTDIVRSKRRMKLNHKTNKSFRFSDRNSLRCFSCLCPIYSLMSFILCSCFSRTILHVSWRKATSSLRSDIISSYMQVLHPKAYMWSLWSLGHMMQFLSPHVSTPSQYDIFERERDI